MSEGARYLVLGLQWPTLRLSSPSAQARLCPVTAPVLVVVSIQWDGTRCSKYCRDARLLENSFREVSGRENSLGMHEIQKGGLCFPHLFRCLIWKLYLTKHLGWMDATGACLLGWYAGWEGRRWPRSYARVWQLSATGQQGESGEGRKHPHPTPPPPPQLLRGLELGASNLAQ